MAYRVKYTVTRAFPWEARDYVVDDEFCEEHISQYQLDSLTNSGKLKMDRTVIFQRAPGTATKTKKKAKAAA